MYANDAYLQQSKLAALRLKTAQSRHGGDSSSNRYPSFFANDERLRLSTPASGVKVQHGAGKVSFDWGWVHFPLIPGRAWLWQKLGWETPGRIRSVYSQNNPLEFDVIYHRHRPRRSTTGETHANEPFLLAKLVEPDHQPQKNVDRPQTTPAPDQTCPNLKGWTFITRKGHEAPTRCDVVSCRHCYSPSLGPLGPGH